MGVGHFRVRNHRGSSGYLCQDCFYLPKSNVVLFRESEDRVIQEGRFSLAESFDVLTVVARALSEGKNPEVYAVFGDFHQSDYTKMSEVGSINEDDLGEFVVALRVEQKVMSKIGDFGLDSTEGDFDVEHSFGKFVNK